MFLINNFNFNEQVNTLANGKVSDGIIELNLEYPLTAEQLSALEEALKKNKEKQWGFQIRGNVNARAFLLQSLPSLCTQISYLNVQFPALTPHEIALVENIITRNKALLHLELVLNSTTATNAFLELLEKTQSSKTLIGLTIYNKPLSNENKDQLVNAIADFLQNNTSLRSLGIFDLLLEQHNLARLASRLAGNFVLQQIANYDDLGPVEEFLARNQFLKLHTLGKPDMEEKALERICQYLEDDYENGDYYSYPKSFQQHTNFLTDNERALVINRLEHYKNNFAQLACAYLLFPETNFYNLIASYMEQTYPEDEAKSHAAITFLIRSSSTPQLRGVAETMLYFFKVGSPFESVQNRLSTLYLNPDERYIGPVFPKNGTSVFTDDRGPTAMPAVPAKPSGFFSQNRNTPTTISDADNAEENKGGIQQKAPGS